MGPSDSSMQTENLVSSLDQMQSITSGLAWPWSLTVTMRSLGAQSILPPHCETQHTTHLATEPILQPCSIADHSLWPYSGKNTCQQSFSTMKPNKLHCPFVKHRLWLCPTRCPPESGNQPAAPQLQSMGNGPSYLETKTVSLTATDVTSWPIHNPKPNWLMGVFPTEGNL